MPQLTTEELSQRILHCRLADNRQIAQVHASMGRDNDLDTFKSQLLQRELLTNWQLTRLLDGHRKGYFYGNWKVLYLVGAGTFARVYRSVNIKTGDVKAVKVLRNRYTDDMGSRERFMREGQTVMKLRHPNIVPIFEVDNYRGRIYMVMDFIEGQNLREFVQAHHKVKLETALDITRDVLNGLAGAANLGISHRDIKLSNVLLSSSGRACLVDFGLAATEGQAQSSGGVYNPRSVDYAGLEKTTNTTRTDKRSDIFFVGCNLYHMLSGTPPMEETRERMKRLSSERYRTIKPLSIVMPDLPHRVIALANKLMALNPADRFQTAKEAADATSHVISAVQQGDTTRYDANLSEQEAAAYAKQTQKINEGEGKTVMVVESNQALQDTLRKRLKKIGYRVLILSDPVRALDRFRHLDPAEDAPADCMIFGSAGLGNLAIEAFNELIRFDMGKTLPCLILIKESRRAEFEARLKLEAHHKTLSLPIKFPRIREALRQLLNIEPNAVESTPSVDQVAPPQPAE